MKLSHDCAGRIEAKPHSTPLSKTLSYSLLLGLMLGAGCAQHYKITLTNGNVITTKSRPKIEKDSNVYSFKDAFGRPTTIPVFKIKEIEAL